MNKLLFTLSTLCFSVFTLFATDNADKAKEILNTARKNANKARFKHFKSENSAILPKTKLENDGYCWFTRFEKGMEIKKSLKPQIVLIGDSITHFWGGLPDSRIKRGARCFNNFFGDLPVLNLGFGWDRTPNVFCRIHAGQLDGIKPKLIVVNIGTNNTSTTKNYTANTAEEMGKAYQELFKLLRKKAPKAKIIAMEIFPREEKSDHPRRKLINSYNVELRKVAKKFRSVTLISLGKEFIDANGNIRRDLMPDRCHPNEKGYEIWANALKPYVDKIRTIK